ncbi:MAG: PP2C family protein-serine/threonine phosphatase [Pyrinomonadaceae bacterium]
MRKAAAAALNQLIGSDANQFALVSEAQQERRREQQAGTRFIWERAIAGEPDVKLQIEATMRGRIISELRMRLVFAANFQKDFDAQHDSVGLLATLNAFVILVVVLVVIGLFFVFAMRREINYTLALVLFGAAFLAMTVLQISAGELEAGLSDQDFRPQRGTDSLRYLLALLETLLLSFFYALCLAAMWGTGFALVRRAGVETKRAASFVALLRGKFLSRFVSGRVAIGIMLGGLLAAIPYLVVASGLFDNLRPEQLNAQWLVAPAPALAALLRPLSYGLFAIYGFLVPLFQSRIRERWVLRALALPFGCLWLWEGVLDELFDGGGRRRRRTLIGVADQIYWRFDFLTLMAAAFAADVVTSAAGLLLQSAPGLVASGWMAVGGLGALCAAALVVSRRGRDTQTEDEAQVAPAPAIGQGLQPIERDRLMAEFGVARLAQQQMLPAAPPAIHGYHITATCRPAREVGGDLFDFLKLPDDDHLGIVVADVSGKGVPASLYMTLTKGLLASVSENESDPSVILREVNRHLYQVCRRKIFVTMLLGVLDPATRTLTYARAGHNPTVWRHTARGASSLLGAPGLGLGMVSGQMFDKSLRPETIRLEPGDVLFFYSDGIPEAMNARGEEYGMERMLAAIERCDELHAAEALDVMLDDVAEFVGETPPHDDITLVVLRVAER